VLAKRRLLRSHQRKHGNLQRISSVIHTALAPSDSIRRFTAYCGIAALFSTLFSIMLIVLSGVNLAPLMRYLIDDIYPQQVVSIDSTAYYALWLFIASHVLLIGFASGFSQMFSAHHWSISLTVRILYTGLMLFILVSLFTIGISKGLAQVVYHSEEISDTLRGTAQTFIAFRNYAGILAGLLVALACLGFGYIFRNSSALMSIWISSAGLLGLGGAFWPLWIDLSYLRNAGYFLFLVWIAYISIIILRRHHRFVAHTS
jgi:hypothetical protein